MGTQGKTRLIWDQNKDAMFSSISESHKGNGATNSLAIYESGAWATAINTGTDLSSVIAKDKHEQSWS